jgi:lipid A 3-O-deacylase
VTIRRTGHWVTISLLAALDLVTGRPATAQFVTFGSPGDSLRIALGGGAFDVLPDSKKSGSGTTGLLWSEFRFGDVLWIVSPLVGLSGTGSGGFYGYFGLGFDIHFAGNWILNPNVAAGYFYHGTGINLGSQWEFRSGAELDYRFADRRRLGVAFYHMSNAGISKENPGAEMATVVFTVPLY